MIKISYVFFFSDMSEIIVIIFLVFLKIKLNFNSLSSEMSSRSRGGRILSGKEGYAGLDDALIAVESISDGAVGEASGSESGRKYLSDFIDEFNNLIAE